MKKINKYYLGSGEIAASFKDGTSDTNSYLLTEKEAIDKAIDRVKNSSTDCAIVVKVIAVIKKDVPITIERLK